MTEATQQQHCYAEQIQLTQFLLGTSMTDEPNMQYICVYVCVCVCVCLYDMWDPGNIQFSSVQSLSHVWLCDPMNYSKPGLPVHHQLLESTQTHVHRVGDAIQPSHPLSSPSPPALNLSSELALCVRWPKYWSFSFNISPSNEHPGLISFRMDWLDLLAVQGTLKSLLQHNSKASILQRSAFFIVQLSLEMLRPAYSWVTHNGGRNRWWLHMGKAVQKNPS